MDEAAQSGGIEVGHELGALRLTLSGEQVRRYAIVAGMPGGRFLSDEEARSEGLPGQIVPGNMSMALFSRLIGAAFPGATLKRLSATFRGLVRPGYALRIHGVVTEKHCTEHGDLVECDLILESDEGDRWVTGTATVQFPPNVSDRKR
jgi:acyl dehydratase